MHTVLCSASVSSVSVVSEVSGKIGPLCFYLSCHAAVLRNFVMLMCKICALPVLLYTNIVCERSIGVYEFSKSRHTTSQKGIVNIRDITDTRL